MKDAAAKFGVADQVIAMPPVNPVTALPRFYQAADLCVQASREEGLGFSVLEALACEVPVVATHVGGLRETIIDGQTGWTYTMGDAGSLAAAITESLSNPQESARRARNGREMVASRYRSDMLFSRLQQWVASELSASKRRLHPR